MNAAPPSEELISRLQRFTFPLYVLAAGYVAVLVMGMVAGQLSNAITNATFLVWTVMIARKSNDQCISGQCLTLFFFWAVMSSVFDVFNLLAMLGRSYPGAGDFFAAHCPKNISASFPKDTQVLVKNESHYDPVVVPAHTQVLYPLDSCAGQWALGNATILIGMFLDLLSSCLGWRIVKALPSDGGEGGFAAGLLGGGAQGGMGRMGGGPGMGGAPRGQEMGGMSMNQGGQQQARQPGWQPYEGTGQRLGGGGPGQTQGGGAPNAN